MAYRVELTRAAYKEFSCIDKKTQIRIGGAVDALADFSSEISLDIKKLKVSFAGYLARVGNYRILFTVEKNTIVIHSIKHRKDAYKL